MPKKKFLGHTTVIKINAATVGFVRSIRPGELSRSETDVTVLDSTIEEFLDADPPNVGTVVIGTLWDPSDAGDDAIDTIFYDADPDDREKDIVIEYTKTGKKDSFKGRILKITPAQVSSKDAMARDIEIRITTKPARAAIV